MKDILIVEDEKNVFRAIKANLGDEKYTFRLVEGASPAYQEIFDIQNKAIVSTMFRRDKSGEAINLKNKQLEIEANEAAIELLNSISKDE